MANLGTAYIRIAPDMSGIQGKISRGMSSAGDAGAKQYASGFSKSGAVIAGAIGGVVATATAKVARMVTSSIGSAVKRVDTLNNSARTFENMGIDAGKAEAAMKRLNTSITGLPTPLDSAVRGMTALTATYGDVDKGQKVFSALNNAILGFGGTANDVDNAIMQLSQLPMDGPLDAQTWNSLRNSGLTPVLVAMAEESGMSVNKMKEAFGEGELTVQDFTDRLMKMDTDGGGGLKSLEQIARDATGGIGTTFANMQTAIVRAMAGFIEAVGTKNVTNAIEGIGKAITFVIDTARLLITGDYAGNMFGGVFEEDSPFVVGLLTARQAILNIFDAAKLLVTGDFKSGMFGGAFEEDSPLINGLLTIREIFVGLPGFVRKNAVAFGLLAGAVLALTAPLIIAAVQAGILDLRIRAMLAWSSLVKVIKGVAAGFRALNAAMMANPIGLVIAAVALLVAGFLLLWNNVEGFRNFFIGAWESIQAAWGGAGEWFGGIIDSIIGFFRAIPGTLSKLFTDAWDGVKSIWNSFIDFAKEWWFIILLAIVTGGLILIVGAITRNWDAIVDFTKKTIDSMIRFFSELPGKLLAIFTRAWEGVKGAWSGVANWFGGVVNSIGNFFNQVPGKASGAFNSAKSTVMGIWNGIPGWFGGIVSNIGSAFNRVVGYVRDAFKKAVAAIKSIDWKGIGMDIIKGIGSGIADMGGWLADQAKAAVGGAKDQLKSFLGIKSPSRVMRDEIGKMMGIGMADGIAATTRDVVNASKGLSAASLSSFSSELPSLSSDISNSFKPTSSKQSATIVVQVGSREIARQMIDDINDISFLNGRSAINI